MPSWLARVFDQLICGSMLTLEWPFPQSPTTCQPITLIGTGLVCGPAGEVGACCQYGLELLSGEGTAAWDGDFVGPQHAVAWRREWTPFPLRRVWCLLSSSLADLHRQQAVAIGSSPPRRKSGLVGRGRAMMYCSLASRIVSKKARACCDIVLGSASHSYLDHPPFGRLFGRLAFRPHVELGVGLMWVYSERSNRVFLQFRLIAGEASTSFVCSTSTLFRCTSCSNCIGSWCLCPDHGTAPWSVAVQFDGGPTVQGDRPQDGLSDPTAPDVTRASSSEHPAELMSVEWARAEEHYGLYRPSPGETVIVVHRQTSKRLAVAPDAWDEIPVHYNMLPGEILSDIAHWYNDIHDDWEQVMWWLCRVHASSRSSSQPVLAATNYVLVQEDDFLAVDMRPHGLVELVFGEDLVVFSTFLPRWINMSILRSFLEPMISRTHFGVAVLGSYNGGVIGHRLIRCESGFFIQVRFLSTPFLLSELYHSAPLHVASLHTVTEYPCANDVRWSVVYIAGGNTLISSRVYERVDVS